MADHHGPWSARFGEPKDSNEGSADIVGQVGVELVGDDPADVVSLDHCIQQARVNRGHRQRLSGASRRHSGKKLIEEMALERASRALNGQVRR